MEQRVVVSLVGPTDSPCYQRGSWLFIDAREYGLARSQRSRVVARPIRQWTAAEQRARLARGCSTILSIGPLERGERANEQRGVIRGRGCDPRGEEEEEEEEKEEEEKEEEEEEEVCPSVPRVKDASGSGSWIDARRTGRRVWDVRRDRCWFDSVVRSVRSPRFTRANDETENDCSSRSESVIDHAIRAHSDISIASREGEGE